MDLRPLTLFYLFSILVKREMHFYGVVNVVPALNVVMVHMAVTFKNATSAVDGALCDEFSLVSRPLPMTPPPNCLVGRGVFDFNSDIAVNLCIRGWYTAK